MDIQFHSAALEDCDELLNMMSEFYAIDGYSFDRNLTNANLQILITNNSFGRIWLIHHSAFIIGYIVLAFSFSFEFKGRNAFIDEFFLKEPYRSQGIGSKAMDFVFGQAKAVGIKALHLEVEKHNEKGSKLYLKKGFTEHNRVLLTKFID